MATLGDAISHLTKAAGIAEDNAALKQFLSNPTISGYDFPDEIFSGITSKLMTKEEAIAKPEIINHFRATHYNGIDAELESTLKEIGKYDELKDLLSAEKSSPKKVTLAVKKLSEKLNELAGSTKGDNSKLISEINELKTQIAGLETTKSEAVKAVESQWAKKVEDMAFTQAIGSHKLHNPAGWDSSLLTKLAKEKVSEVLKSKGYQTKLNENGSLELITAEGTKVFENNKEVGINDFLQKTLLESKLLEVSQPPHPRQPNPTQAASSSANNGTMSKFAQAAQASLEAVETQTT